MTEKLGVSKERRVWSITGVGLRPDVFGAHNANRSNLLRGVYERVLYRVVAGQPRHPPSPAVGVFERDLSEIRQRIVRGVAACRPITREKFVSLYSGRRQSIYQRASDSLAVRPLVESDSFLSTFTKCEKINFLSKPDPAPRVIQPRTPRFNVEVGRYLKPLEKKVVASVAEAWGGTTVMKGLNAEGVGSAFAEMWAEFTDPVAFSLDAVRFDQHVSVDALKWEHSVYAMCFSPRDRPKLLQLLEWQLTNRGFAYLPEVDLKYIVMGHRMSGDMNTSLGNCLLMCSIILLFSERVGRKMRLANNGDDCVIVLERRDMGCMDGISAHMLEFGFVIELEDPVYVLEEINFCQTHPVFDGCSWIMMRDPRVCIDKDLCTVLDLSTEGGCKTWAHAIGSCGLAMTAGLPIMASFYTMLLRNGKAGKVLDSPWMDGGFTRMAAGLARSNIEVTSEARVSFWRAFGLLPDIQTAMEESYGRMQLDFSAGELITPHQFIPLLF